MFSRWIVTNITSAIVTTFLAFLAGIISWSVYCMIRVVNKRPFALHWSLIYPNQFESSHPPDDT
jgi:hypothetical protein